MLQLIHNRQGKEMAYTHKFNAILISALTIIGANEQAVVLNVGGVNVGSSSFR